MLRCAAVATQQHRFISLGKFKNQGEVIPAKQVEGQHFERFYVFSYIIHARMLLRTQMFVTGTIICLFPVTALLYIAHLPLLSFQQVLVASGISSGILFIIGHLMQRIVGMLSINEKQDIVKVSSLSRLGKRVDIYLPAKSVLPLEDVPGPDIFMKFHWQDSSDYFLLSKRFGKVLDNNQFERVVGWGRYL